MDVSLLRVLCVVMQGSLGTADHSFRGVPPSLVRLNECYCETPMMRRPTPARGFCAMKNKIAPVKATGAYV